LKLKPTTNTAIGLVRINQENLLLTLFFFLLHLFRSLFFLHGLGGFFLGRFFRILTFAHDFFLSRNDFEVEPGSIAASEKSLSNLIIAIRRLAGQWERYILPATFILSRQEKPCLKTSVFRHSGMSAYHFRTPAYNPIMTDLTSLN
jgi:hypothetical protein